MNGKFFGTMIVVFVIVSGGAYALSRQRPEFAFMALMGGNVLMFALSIIAWLVTKKTLQERPQAFVRGVFSATLIKMFAVMAAVLIYALANRDHLYKPLVFALFGIYVIYTAVETMMMSKTAKGIR